MRLFLFMLIIGLFLPAALSANTPPIPASKKQRLESISENLKEEKSKSSQLESEVKELEQDLKDTKKGLVKLGRSIQYNEAKLQDLQDRITEKNIEKLKIEQELEQDHKSISRLVLALQRIRRVPPEALIVKPGAPLETAQSAMLMRDILPTLYREAQKLESTIEKLEELSYELQTEKERALATSRQLAQEHERLSTLIDKRQNLYKKTNKDLADQQDYVEKIATQVESLNELIKKLEIDKKRKKAREQSHKAILASVKRAIPGLNQSQLPVSGYISLAFDQTDKFGGASKGVEITSTAGALVVAPMSGTVRFAGPFKNYRNLIILEHDSGYHSLIAGLKDINTTVGHTVSAGEPLGTLNFTSEGTEAVLYYELRLNGKPINPAKKLKGFS